MYRSIKPFLLMALSFILVIACHQHVIQKSDILTRDLEGSAKCRIVQHDLGETCILIRPRRIIVLDEYTLLDPVLALGIKPVGFTPCFICISPNTRKFVADTPSVGDIASPSLEKILSLKPDLILGLKWQENFYPLLSKIAPTVMIDPETRGFKKALTYLAEILDRSDRVERILAEYNRQIQKFRQKLGKKLKTKTVSIIYLPSSGTFVVHRPEFTVYGQVMSDAGIQFIPAYKDLKNDGYNTLSIETLSDWDADFLFILANYERDSKNLKSLSFLKEPIWSTLKAVQNKQVYGVSWDVSGPITANQFIDDLYEYFINKN
ncbi:ABC transporter substrate-binding protein [Scytonema millei]|nr:iron-siderophore ABC transporter substrate-binding protein [Scytonema millei]